jgi:ferredoxin
MPTVTFKNTGQGANATDDQPLKDVVKDANWPIAFACEDGVCGTCLIKTAPGESNLSPMDEKEKITLESMGMDSSTHRLACQCRVKGDVTIEQ